MSKKVIVPGKNYVSVDEIDNNKVYIFINHGNIYKSNFVKIDELSGFAFIPIFGSCHEIKHFGHAFLSWSVKLAIEAGNDVHELQDESELVDIINNFINSI